MNAPSTGAFDEMKAEQNRFSERLLELLDHVEYRRVETGEDMEDVARIRFKAYKMADILPLSGTMLIDDIDFDSHAYVFGIYFEERLISTVRVHHVTPEHRVSSSGSVFGAEIDSFLDAGLSLIDPVRLAADPEILKEMPAIPYLTLRVATMASEHFDVDRCLSAGQAAACRLLQAHLRCRHDRFTAKELRRLQDRPDAACRPRPRNPALALYAVSVFRFGSVRAAHDVRG